MSIICKIVTPNGNNHTSFQKTTDTNGHAPSEGAAEYYQLWRSTGGVSSSDTMYDTLYPNPPPLPPRAVHKPLHRTNAMSAVPLKLPRRHAQKLSAPLRPEDCFGFEIVDVDEASNLKVTKKSSHHCRNKHFLAIRKFELLIT